MNNKGFTLVEVLAVIALLGIIMAIVFPVLNSTLFDTKTSINKLAVKNIKESAEMLAQDIYVCNGTSPVLDILKNELNYSEVKNCKDARAKLESGIDVPIEVLINNNYITKASNCEGYILMYMSGNKMSNINVDASNITCKS
ncbi:MAG: type II secretion system protein [Bacilli bacterium]|nr:type II secretion system protein [Bacilli bacterium]